MRHLRFGFLLATSLVFALFLALPFTMTECGLMPTATEEASCNRIGRMGWLFYQVSFVATLAASIVSHIRGARRTWIAVAAVAVGPFLFGSIAVSLAQYG